MDSHAQVGLALGTAAGAWVNLTLLIWFAARANLITIEPALWKSMARIAFAGLLLAIALLLCQRPVEAFFAGWRFSQEAMLLRARADRRDRLWRRASLPRSAGGCWS